MLVLRHLADWAEEMGSFCTFLYEKCFCYRTLVQVVQKELAHSVGNFSINQLKIAL